MHALTGATPAGMRGAEADLARGEVGAAAALRNRVLRRGSTTTRCHTKIKYARLLTPTYQITQPPFISSPNLVQTSFNYRSPGPPGEDAHENLRHGQRRQRQESRGERQRRRREGAQEEQVRLGRGEEEDFRFQEQVPIAEGQTEQGRNSIRFQIF